MRTGVDCKGREWEERELSKTAIDIHNQKFNKLLPLFPVTCNGRIQWLCKCDCGNFVVARYSELNSGTVKSCGCAKSEHCKIPHNELIGKKFGKLQVLSYEGKCIMPDGKTARHMYKCQCDCGSAPFLIQKISLTTGHSLSCGCLQKEIVTKKWENFREENNIVGKRFGKLTVTKFAGIKDNNSLYECACDCGNVDIYWRFNLVSGYSKSCGCLLSIGEENINSILTKNDIHYKKQYTFNDLISDNGYRFRYDFGILNEDNKVVRLIEFDGPQHYEAGGQYTEDDVTLIKEHDRRKTEYALSHNIPLVRIPYSKRDSMCLDDILGDKYLIKENDTYGQ